MPDRLLVSNPVTAEDAVRYERSNGIPAVLALAGECMEFTPWGLQIKAANGTRHPVPDGYWVVRFGPGDIGVMSPGAFRRWFGEAEVHHG